jgi:predicted ferric reductase
VVEVVLISAALVLMMAVVSLVRLLAALVVILAACAKPIPVVRIEQPYLMSVARVGSVALLAILAIACVKPQDFLVATML